MTLKSERIREQLRDIQVRREQIIADSTRMQLERLQSEQIELTETYVPPRTRKETTGIRLTSDKTTSDNCPGSLSDVRG